MLPRRRNLILAFLSAVGLGFVLSGRPTNPLADALISGWLSGKASLSVSCEGARISAGGLRLDFDRLVVGGPLGYGTEPLASVESGAIAFERTSFTGRRFIGFAAKRAELLVTVAGDGTNSLDSALEGAGLRGETDLAFLSIERFDAAVLEMASGSRHWIREGRVTAMLSPREVLFANGMSDSALAALTASEFHLSGRVESDARQGSFDVRYAERSSDSREIAIQARGFDLAAISPAIMPWLGGGSIAGACEFELDLSWQRDRRFAVGGQGEIRQPALRMDAWAPMVGIGESTLRMTGGLDFDLATRRVRAEAFRLESEAVFVELDGEFALDGPAPAANASGVVAIGFDRAAQRYGPVLAPLLREIGIAGITGVVDLRAGVAASLETPTTDGALPVVLSSERMTVSRVDGRALLIGDASLTATLESRNGDLEAKVRSFGTAAWTLHGTVTCLRAFRSDRDFALELSGDLFPHRLEDPIVAYAGSMPVFLNGEGKLSLAILGVAPVLHGRLVYESADTDVRFDDLRPGVSDIWNFRGNPYRVEADFRFPHEHGLDLDSAVVTGRVDAERAGIVRDLFVDLDLPFSLRDRRITLGPFTAGYFEGRVGGEVEAVIAPDATAIVHARLECSNARLQHFTAYVGALATGVLAGPYAPLRTRGDNLTSGWVEVEGRGDSLTAISRSLRGNGAIEIGAGAIEGSSFLEAWLPSEPSAPQSRRIESLRASFFVEDGSVASNDVILEAAGRTLRLSGRSTPKDIVDYAIAPEDWCGPALFARVRDHLDPRAIAIRGPISEPTLSLPDVSAWERSTDSELKAAISEFGRR